MVGPQALVMAQMQPPTLARDHPGPSHHPHQLPATVSRYSALRHCRLQPAAEKAAWERERLPLLQHTLKINGKARVQKARCFRGRNPSTPQQRRPLTQEHRRLHQHPKDQHQHRRPHHQHTE